MRMEVEGRADQHADAVVAAALLAAAVARPDQGVMGTAHATSLLGEDAARGETAAALAACPRPRTASCLRAMDWTLTLAAIGLGAVATAFSAWRSGRPRKDSLRPKWISWR